MARIAGVNIPTDKRVPVALSYIHGIGPQTAKQICTELDLDASRRVNELSDADVLKIREYIDANCVVEGDLRRQLAVNKKRLMDLLLPRDIGIRRHVRMLVATYVRAVQGHRAMATLLRPTAESSQ